MESRSKTVAGESVDTLVRALAQMKSRKKKNGMVSLSGKLEPELGMPLMRAISRVEQDLFEEDRARGEIHLRTPAQRQADAFIALLERLGLV